MFLNGGNFPLVLRHLCSNCRGKIVYLLSSLDNWPLTADSLPIRYCCCTELDKSQSWCSARVVQVVRHLFHSTTPRSTCRLRRCPLKRQPNDCKTLPFEMSNQKLSSHWNAYGLEPCRKWPCLDTYFELKVLTSVSNFVDRKSCNGTVSKWGGNYREIGSTSSLNKCVTTLKNSL